MGPFTFLCGQNRASDYAVYDTKSSCRVHRAALFCASAWIDRI